MNRFLKTAVLGLAVAATTVATLPAAQAGDWRRHDGWRHHNRGGEAIAAGVLGLAVGALVAGAANSRPDYYVDDYGVARSYGRPVYAEPVYGEPVYREPRVRPSPVRRYYEPQVVYANRSIEPWSPAWYRYCESRYRSFNARTGTFVGYDGVARFCNAN